MLPVGVDGVGCSEIDRGLLPGRRHSHEPIAFGLCRCRRLRFGRQDRFAGAFCQPPRLLGRIDEFETPPFARIPVRPNRARQRLAAVSMNRTSGVSAGFIRWAEIAKKCSVEVRAVSAQVLGRCGVRVSESEKQIRAARQRDARQGDRTAESELDGFVDGLRDRRRRDQRQQGDRANQRTIALSMYGLLRIGGVVPRFLSTALCKARASTSVPISYFC